MFVTACGCDDEFIIVCSLSRQSERWFCRSNIGQLILTVADVLSRAVLLPSSCRLPTLSGSAHGVKYVIVCIELLRCCSVGFHVKVLNICECMFIAVAAAPVQCAPLNASNAQINTTMTSYLTVTNITCNMGYSLGASAVTSMTTQCGADGSWYPTVAECSREYWCLMTRCLFIVRVICSTVVFKSLKSQSWHKTLCVCFRVCGLLCGARNSFSIVLKAPFVGENIFILHNVGRTSVGPNQLGYSTTYYFLKFRHHIVS